MLRLLVLLLLLLNGMYFAWSQGLLRPYGFAPTQQTEPQRVARQIRPEVVRILSVDEARRAELAAPTAGESGECLQAGLFDDLQTVVLRQAAKTVLPPGSWLLDDVVEPARWIVYMGRYADTEALNKKRTELRQRSVSFEPLNNPALEPGLSLGSFATQSEANDELARISTRGVKTARVVQSRPEVRGQKLRFAAVDASLRAQLDTLRPKLLGKTLRLCE